MLGSEGRDAFVAEVLFGQAEGVADGVEAGIEDAYDIARKGFVEDLAVAGHELLGLGQALDASGLYVADVHADLVAA